MKALSEQMKRALDAIKTHGGSARPIGGGWWNGADNRRLEYEPSSDSNLSHLNGSSHIVHHLEPVRTCNIYALEARGLLRRANIKRARHADTYLIV